MTDPNCIVCSICNHPTLTLICTCLIIPACICVCYNAQIFNCVAAASEGGGDSTYVDGFAIADILRKYAPEAFQFFSSTPFRYFCYDDGYHLEATGPVFQLSASGQVILVRTCMAFAISVLRLVVCVVACLIIATSTQTMRCHIVQRVYYLGAHAQKQAHS